MRSRRFQKLDRAWNPTTHLPIEAFRKVEGPKILEVLREARRERCVTSMPLRPPDKIVASDRADQIDAMTGLLAGDRTHFPSKLHHSRREGT